MGYRPPCAPPGVGPLHYQFKIYALDSMLTTRIYRAARPLDEALEELRLASTSQFCPRCVAALERILPLDALRVEKPAPRPALLAAS